jgi:hypothetical protein
MKGPKLEHIPWVICALCGIPSFAITLFVRSISAVQVNLAVLVLLVQTSVQLLGFGGVIFAVLYHEQRKMIAKHRSEANKGAEILKESVNLPITERPEVPFAETGRKTLQHQQAVMEGADIYVFCSRSFLAGFLASGIGLIIQLIHLVGFDIINTLSIYAFAEANLLISLEIALMAIAVGSFIVAWVVSLKLPLEPG